MNEGSGRELLKRVIVMLIGLLSLSYAVGNGRLDRWFKYITEVLIGGVTK